ncbi:glycosyltransferase [Bacteroidota bacterium]|nr:glycosyltransferase [Bacteroidota bacterium]MDC3229725.1 glycosyltransferase [Bacteroidota bacterium]
MKITWVTRSFLDYRIPIYEEINRLSNNQLIVIYNAEVTPLRCQEGLKKILGSRAVGLKGEIRFGGKKIENQTFANKGGLRIPLLPGLINKIKKSEPDIILSDGFFQWTYAALINNAIWQTPHLMLYERTKHTERNVSFLRYYLRQIASKFITAISCNGIQTKEYLQEFGIAEKKLFIGNMAADSSGLQNAISKISKNEILKLKKSFNLKEDVFLFVGQLIPRKGVIELIKAWKDFEKNFSNASLVLLGSGEQLELASDLLNKHRINNVCLPGKVDYSEVATFYAVADIFIIPTLEDNWSLVVPEAMSCSLPIICSKYNGCWPELVKKENGWVFDPLDTSNFNHTLNLAYKNKEKWKEMGESSAKIVSDFSTEKIANKIVNSCKEIISDK